MDNVSTGAGNDFIYSESTGGSVDGGDGYDRYTGHFGASTTALTIEIGDSIELSNGIVVTNVESIGIGSGSGDDLFIVTRPQGVNVLYAGTGNDTLVYNAPSTAGLHFQVYADSDRQLGGTIGPVGSELRFGYFESVSSPARSTMTGSKYPAPMTAPD